MHDLRLLDGLLPGLNPVGSAGYLYWFGCFSTYSGLQTVHHQTKYQIKYGKDMSNDSGIKLPTIRDGIFIVFKYKYTIIITFLLAVLIALIYCLYAESSYKAETRILVKIGREKFSGISASPRESYNFFFSERREDRLNELEILKSDYLALKVLDSLQASQLQAAPKEETFFTRIRGFLGNLKQTAADILYRPLYFSGLVKELSDREKSLLKLSRSFDTESIEDTDVIVLSFSWNDPDLAAFIVNLYASEYLKLRRGVFETEDVHIFYAEQAVAFETQLNQAENELRDFLATYNIINISQQKDTLLQEISELEAQSRAHQLESDDLRIKINEVTAARHLPDTWIETPGIGKLGKIITDLQTLDSAFFSLQAERFKMMQLFLPSAREVQDIDRQILKIKDQKAESILFILQTELYSIQSSKQFLKATLQEKRQAIEKLAALDMRLMALERNVNILKDNYLLYIRKAEELRISDDLDKRQIQSVSVISPAIPPIQPEGPRKILVLGLSGFLGLFFGFGLTLLKKYFDHTFEFESDVIQHLNVPLLAVIPHQKQRG